MLEKRRVMSDLSVGDVALRAGVAVSALHFYERKGLIRSHRTAGNQRRYGRDVLRRVGVIRSAQALGLSLEEIGMALATLPRDRAPSAADWARLAEGWREGLEKRIARLELLRDTLTGCIGCGCLSMEACPLRNPDDAMAAQGGGAHFLDPDGSAELGEDRKGVEEPE